MAVRVTFLTLACVLACASRAACQTVPARPGSGSGAEFNGRTSYAVVDLGRTPAWPQLSVAAWVKVRSTAKPQVFLNRGAAGALFTFYIFRGQVRMLVEPKPGAYTHATAPVPEPNTWTHYAGTYDGANIKIYMNGELVKTTKAPGQIAASSAELYLGALSSDERHLDGWLEDARLWLRALSAAEVERVVAGEGVDEGLLARWAKPSLAGGSWRNLAGDQWHARYYKDPKPVFRKDDGYRGIWYCNQKLQNEYVYKYSGGLGTYCAKHIPFAYYAKQVNKTFFCYGGAKKDQNVLLHMVSYYDHNTGLVPRPTILLNKRTSDAHDNPTIMLDDSGYVWIFSSSHGRARPSFIHRSAEPYSVDQFERVATTNFSYTQPWHLPGQGFLFLHTLYIGGRSLFQMTSRDGVKWDEPELLSRIDAGHYQVSWPWRKKLGTAFNYHPKGVGLNWRTNLYYMESSDFGKTWHNAQGQPVQLPLSTPDNPALARDYKAEGLVVYMKDLSYDSQGRPIILYITSRGFESGPKNDPRTWTTGRWTGSEWEFSGGIVSDNNYDMGSLYVESDDLWRLIAPTQPGPQRYNPGGEVALWVTRDQGRHWEMVKQLTHDSEYNHTYVRRPVHAHPDFYALWADGHGRQPSESRLYFTDRAGSRVWRLPTSMAGEFARPEPLE